MSVAIRSLQNACDQTSLYDSLCEVTDILGFHYFALSRHPNRVSDKRVEAPIHNYPEGWADEYEHKKLFLADPVHRACHRWACGFRWKELSNIIPLQTHDAFMIDQAKRFGIEEGFTIPTNVPGAIRGSVTFATMTGQAFPESQLLDAQACGSILFQSARMIAGDLAYSPRGRLTDRQLECVLWAGRGKTNSEIATILDIEPDTVKKHLSAAFVRYDVVKRGSLAYGAMLEGVLCLTDVFP